MPSQMGNLLLVSESRIGKMSLSAQHQNAAHQQSLPRQYFPSVTLQSLSQD